MEAGRAKTIGLELMALMMLPRSPVSMPMSLRRSTRLLIAVHGILNAQISIAERLERAAQLEGQGDGGLGGEEPKHLHGVADQPAGEDRHAEALARLGAVVGQDLRDGENRFDAETDEADQRRVRAIDPRQRRQEELAEAEADEEGEEKLPISGARRCVSAPFYLFPSLRLQWFR
jgi:hypothetical protein